jgi:hypothetical protein
VIVTVSILLVAASGAASGFVRMSSSSAKKFVCWDVDSSSQPELQGGELTYRLHVDGPPGVPVEQAQAALVRAFQQWEGDARSRIAFKRGADTTTRANGNDNEFPVFWTVDGVFDQGTADPGDDVSLGGALGVSYSYWYTSQEGCEPGSLRAIDTAIALNDTYDWTTDPSASGESSKYDIQSVAVHEIGHSIGLDHSPLCASSMFPRVRAGTTNQRTPSEDDRAGVARMYPDGNWDLNTGSLAGVLRKSGAGGVFGGSVFATDANGVVLVQTLSDTDGTYELAGLPPGPHTVCAETIDPRVVSTNLFDEDNIGGKYSGLDVSFLASADVSASVVAGATTSVDIETTGAAPAVNVYRVGRNGSYSTTPRMIDRGGAEVRVGVSGPGIPQSGEPLSISGVGYTVNGAPVFGTVGADPKVELRVSFDADAAVGPRNLIVDTGSERAFGTACLEVTDGFPGGAPGAVDDGTGDSTPLSLRTNAGRVELRWGRENGASFYSVLRGTLDALRSGSYDHGAIPGDVNGHCMLSHEYDTLVDDLADARAYYYLIGASNESGDGPLGTDSSGSPRPAGSPACGFDGGA